jgi:hypothetical protein
MRHGRIICPMLARFANMGYLLFGAATVQMLPDLCSDKIGFTVQIHRITQQLLKKR